MDKILYISPGNPTFSRQDIDELGKHYQVVASTRNWDNPLRLGLNFIIQFLWLLRHIRGAQAVLVSFAGYISILPVVLGKLFRVRVFIILNGTESVCFRSFNYGLLRKPLTRWAVGFSVRHAYKLLPVSQSLVKSKNTFVDEQGIWQGIYHFFPKLRTPCEVIPNGFDTDFWVSDTSDRRKQSVITTASANTWKRARLKGVDCFIAMAREFTHISFTLVGVKGEVLKNIDIPENLHLIGFVDAVKLKELYNSHRFYAQLSINEGFGCALAEAMLCGCVPVISSVEAMIEIVGTSGVVVEKRDIGSMKQSFQKAFDLSEKQFRIMSIESQKQILNNFSISHRISQLIEEVDG